MEKTIVIHIDSMADTGFLKKCYEGLDNIFLLYNPTKEEVNSTLYLNPSARVMMLGHGSSNGLFSKGWDGMVIDSSNAHLLVGRECIGIWCHAWEFAAKYGLKGFFTGMFISNLSESRGYGFTAKEKDVYDEVAKFSEMVNNLIKEDVPMDKWLGVVWKERTLCEGFEFVEWNYKQIRYFGENDRSDEYLAREYYDAVMEDFNPQDLMTEPLEDILFRIFSYGFDAGRQAVDEI